jgi:crotonobetainyl-CoA:carnitine CoA-transferase CaiB-like acyl-CoA transferase
LAFRHFVSLKRQHKQNTKTKHMKKLLTLTGIVSIGAVLALLVACQTTGTGQTAQKESLLSQSGFKVITVTTPKQQQAVSGLAQGRCSAVKYNGKLYYVYPTGTKDRIYVGRQKQYNAYKQALAAQQASQPASQQAQPGQQLIAGQSLMPTLETAGPNNIEVQQFGGFGPMGTAALGDW